MWCRFPACNSNPLTRGMMGVAEAGYNAVWVQKTGSH